MCIRDRCYYVTGNHEAWIGGRYQELEEKLLDTGEMCIRDRYVKGDLPKEDEPAAAIIGARECSAYGRQTAERMAKELAEAGVTIISGLARGIDGAGHKGALDGGGKTFAVLGCGVNICYPRSNYRCV